MQSDVELAALFYPDEYFDDVDVIQGWMKELEVAAPLHVGASCHGSVTALLCACCRRCSGCASLC
jgi:hypothetical protein